MKQSIWKKAVLICLVIGALVFAFWYGGDAPGLQGFAIDDEETYTSQAADSEDSVAVGEEADGIYDRTESKDNIVRDSAGKGTSSEVSGNDSEKISDTAKSKDGGTFSFKNIFMKIKQTGSSKKAQKNNPQYNKTAKRNANRAVEKSKKKKSKKSNKENGSSDNSENNRKENGDGNSEKNNDSDDNTGNNNDDSGKNITCTIDISCASVLEYMDKLTEAKRSVIPENGIILDTVEVKVDEDSTVFDVLQKAARENKVHLEYNYTPAYKTYYIEGIGNLYQFDAGNLSGWMYSVNGEFPGVGCSGYKVKGGDKISWVYTCSFGKDVGGYVESGN